MIRRQSLIAIFAVIVVLFSFTKSEAKRLALVIGNSDYKFGRLNNAENDAKDIATALSDVGFDVTRVLNGSKSEMGSELARWSKRVSYDDVALFYFAGHGLQINNSNYLLGVDTKESADIKIDDISISLDDVLSSLKKVEMRIVILDACRSNPFAETYFLSGERMISRSPRGIAALKVPKGFSPVSSSKINTSKRGTGTFIAFATDIGNVAYDGTGRNGMFTKYLLKYIKAPGFRLEDVFKRVRESVADETNNGQIPWDQSSITGVFYFVKPEDRTRYKRDESIFVPVF